MVRGQRQCEALRKNGEPCQGWALPGSRYCFAHDPGRAAERAAARKKGGLHRRKRAADRRSFSEQVSAQSFRTMDDIEALLETALKATLVLPNSISRNRALGFLAGQWARVHEVGSLEDRLSALEQRLKGWKPAGYGGKR